MAQSFPNSLKNNAARSLRDASIRDVIEIWNISAGIWSAPDFIFARTKHSSFGPSGTRFGMP